ncbi:DUF2911 domain-containing protein [Aureibaculum conchae]|uniref:DUF2911 domain-containing protein n=1 Tax=Aureibaculum sp. 2308TA14-22 TaxID=3108392 RepID=UPI0033941DF7
MKKTIFTFILIIIFFYVNAQDSDYPYPSLSPNGTISQTVGNTVITIDYERPSVRKRQIFGHLVPWNKVWRTGAGKCTRISFDKSVIVGGQKIEAGSYSLFTIPNQKEWTIILNSDTSLYGSYDYDAKKDVARFIVIPNESDRFYEALNFDIEILPNDAKIFFSWANIQFSFDVKTTTDSEIEELIETDLLTKKSKDSRIYAGASEYLLFQDRNFSDALKLAGFAIELDKNNGWARSLRIKIYEKLKLYDEALAEVDIFIKHIQSRKYDNEKEKENIMRELRSDHVRISNLMK